MQLTLPPSWKALLQDELDKPYFIALSQFVKLQYANHRCYPPESLIFNALTSCPVDQVKVVIIGQDPYHGMEQAHGLSFSVPDGVKIPPSLVNIYKELATDLKIHPKTNGNLTSWAKQGVLLLNATLTVQEGRPGSHQKQGWEQFTDAIINKLATTNNNLVFLLWGGFAKNKGKKINPVNHCVLKSGHPSPLSANRGYWFGNKHFSQANSYLVAHGKTAIKW